MRFCRLAGLCFGLASLLPGQIQQSTRSIPGQVCGLTEVAAVAAGGIGGLALKTDGTVWEWYGPSAPAQVSGLSGLVAIAAGIGHDMALKSDGTVWEWNGPWSWGGPGSERLTRTPSQVSGITDVVAIAAGESRSLAVKTDGTVWEWTGEPAAAFSGVAPEAAYQVSELSGVSAVSVAFEEWWGVLLTARSLALKGDGTVWVWDEGASVKTRVPVQVSGLTDLVAITASHAHNIALKSDGTVWQWPNEVTLLPVIALTPVQVTDLTGVLAVAAGAAQVGTSFSVAPSGLALKRDGTVWAWGGNQHGQLGDGTTTSRTSPVQVSGLREVVAIAAGDVYTATSGERPVSLAVQRDGTVWSWGETWNAWLGDGTTCEEPRPESHSRLR